MARKKIAEVVNGSLVAVIYKDYDWNEYVVVAKGSPDPDASGYHTDNKDDAIGTARHMVGLVGHGTPQGLNDAEVIHTSKGQMQGAEAVRLASEAANNAASGDCAKAMQLLHSAYGHMGAAVAHSGAGGRIEMGTVSGTVERAAVYINRYCKISSRSR